MRHVAIFCLLEYLCILVTPVNAVEFTLSGPDRVCRFSGGSSVRVNHSVASTTTVATFPESIDLSWFTREPGSSGVSRAEIAGVKNPVHAGLFECLTILATKCREGDLSAIAFTSEKAVIFVESSDSTNVGSKHRLARLRVSTSARDWHIQKGSLNLPSNVLLCLGIPESNILACCIDAANQTETYVVGDFLKWRNRGDSSYSEISLASNSKALAILRSNKPLFRSENHESLVLSGGDIGTELESLKALCVIPREEAAENWFQHPRMYFLER